MNTLFKFLLEIAQKFTPELVTWLARFWKTFKIDNPVAASIVQVILLTLNGLIVSGQVAFANADIQMWVALGLSVLIGAVGSSTYNFLPKPKEDEVVPTIEPETTQKKDDFTDKVNSL